MSLNLRRYLLALSNFDHVVRSVPARAWSNPSPCEGWTAADVAGHAMAVIANVGARVTGAPMLDMFTNPAATAGTDPLATWRSIRADVMEALDRPGALQMPTEFGGNQVTVDSVLGTVMGDALIHAWDIARATGVDERLEPELLPVALAALEARGETVLRAPNRYKAALDSTGSADDAQARLLAFAGRNQ